MNRTGNSIAWVGCSHPALPVRLRYPDPTPGGQPVSVAEIGQPGQFRIHLTSQDRQELYFEVGFYHNLDPHTAYEQLQHQQSRLEPELEVRPLQDVRLIDRKAFHGEMRWPDRRRVFYFLPLGSGHIRVIFNPESDLNYAILGTLQLVDPGESEPS